MNWNIAKLYLKTNKPLFASVAILGLLAMGLDQMVLPLTAQAADVQFNTFTPYTHTQTYNHDYYLLDVKNDTKGTDWNFPVSADAGDTLTFYLYYHNSSNYTTANNTTLKVNLPSSQNTSQSVTGYVWADNATNATAANPLSQSVQVNLSTSQSLQYVAGSAKWYPNQADWRYASATSFPNNQPDTQLFSSGINIGSINGCWEYSGAIVFKARVGSTQLLPMLTIDKKIKNITANDYSWSEALTNAHPRQQLAVQLTITNNGQGTANNVIVRDVLPDKLEYVYGSTRLDNNAVADSIISGLNIGNLVAGQTKTIYFETTLATEVNFIRGTTNLTNLADARADNASESQDTAAVSVYYDGCSSEQQRPQNR